MTRDHAPGSPRRFVSTAVLALLATACSAERTVRPDPSVEVGVCNIPIEHILIGQIKDGIPALTDPDLLTEGQFDSPYPAFEDRVVGVVVGDEAIAVPLRIFWYHEIVNLTIGGRAVAITHCPLTGSSLAFDRGSVGDVEFGVSGLLYQNNLIMYDRTTGAESLWPQMLRGASCGVLRDQSLAMVPAIEMTWTGWRGLYPQSAVVSEETGWRFDYQDYPYGNYDRPNNGDLLFPLPGGIDSRRPPKERVLGIPDGRGGVAYPYGELEKQADLTGDLAAVHGTTSRGPHVVFWDERRVGGMAFRPEVDGQALTFSTATGAIVDDQTGSTWNVAGAAVDGPLVGAALEPIDDTFVAFWFAWPAFYPQLTLWLAP